jgi:hypothetical protein
MNDGTFLNGHLLPLAFFIADPDKNKVVIEFMQSSIWKLFIKSRLVGWKYRVFHSSGVSPSLMVDAENEISGCLADR